MRERDSGALQFNCPQCGVRAGRLCVYMWPHDLRKLDPRPDKTLPMHVNNRALNILINKSPENRRKMLMAGVPMHRCHNDRLSLLQDAEQRRSRLGERERLRRWLLKYGDIFEMGQPTSS